MGGLGVPVFNAQGKVLGMICRCVKAEGGDGNSMTRSTLISQLILPVADIVKLVPQAKEESEEARRGRKKDRRRREETGRPPKKKPATPEKKPAETEKTPAVL